MNYYTSNHGATMNSESYYPVNSGKPLNETAGLFSAFFKEKRKELCEKMSRKISTKEIGLMLDIDYESFRKIINKQKQTKKRNVIKLTIIGKNTGVCSRDSGILLFSLGLERHDKQTDQKICL